MILVGTMASFAGSVQKNTTQIPQQMATDDNMKKVTVVDDSGKTIQASERIQYALDLKDRLSRQTGEESENWPAEIARDEHPGPDSLEDLIQIITSLMMIVTNLVAETIKNRRTDYTSVNSGRPILTDHTLHIVHFINSAKKYQVWLFMKI